MGNVTPINVMATIKDSNGNMISDNIRFVQSIEYGSQEEAFKATERAIKRWVSIVAGTRYSKKVELVSWNYVSV